MSKQTKEERKKMKDGKEERKGKERYKDGRGKK